MQDGGGKGRSRVVENTLKNSPVFGGVFQDVRDEMLEQNKNAARYNVSHEVDSMAEAADRIQADPKGEAEYLLTDNDGHVWSAPDIDTAMGLIASNQLDGNEARGRGRDFVSYSKCNSGVGFCVISALDFAACVRLALRFFLIFY